MSRYEVYTGIRYKPNGCQASEFIVFLVLPIPKGPLGIGLGPLLHGDLFKLATGERARDAALLRR